MMCNTRLSLSLGLSTPPPHQHNNKGKLSSNDDDNQELTLCLSTSSEFTNNYDNNNRINPQLLGGVNSSVSSFSNTSSVKRERDHASSFDEEVENLETKKVLIISPKGLVDHNDDDDYGTRKKLRLTKEQSDVLEDSFKEHTTLNSVIHQ